MREPEPMACSRTTRVTKGGFRYYGLPKIGVPFWGTLLGYPFGVPGRDSTLFGARVGYPYYGPCPYDIECDRTNGYKHTGQQLGSSTSRRRSLLSSARSGLNQQRNQRAERKTSTAKYQPGNGKKTATAQRPHECHARAAIDQTHQQRQEHSC